MSARLVFCALTVALLVWVVFAVRSLAGEPPSDPTVPSPTTGAAPAGPPAGAAATLEAARLRQRLRAEHRRYLQARRRVRQLQRVLRQGVSTGGDSLARAFLCIHHYEGSWTDPGAPFWGGVQMDYAFQRAYGREFLAAWGTADHWPPFIQLAVAMRAYLSGRGFTPWPNTSRACGLR
jgi:hypothetical protein